MAKWKEAVNDAIAAVSAPQENTHKSPEKLSSYKQYEKNLSLLNEEQNNAHNLILSGDNTYITGVGGTGKSFLITTLIESIKEDMKTAVIASSTGISALSIGGVTIHSLLGTGINGTVDDIESYVATPKAKRKFKDNLRDVDVIIVDEISMLSGPYIDMMDYYLRSMRHTDVPFGGYQMVFSGDFCQLPPIFRDGDEKLYAFQSGSWQRAGVVINELTHSFRQEEQDFVNILNRVRMGECDDEVKGFFSECVGRDLDHPTKLFPTNQESFRYNMRQLNELEGKELTFDATFFGQDKYKIEQIKKNCIAETELIVKIGAPVIIINNNRNEGYVNGSRGILQQIDDGGAYVKLLDNTIVYARKYEWELLGPELDENGDHEILASMNQYPIKLAYSITMHKSQGMTLDYLSLDLSRCFASGQAYVALSRVRTKEGLSLDKPINPRQIFVDPVLVDFHKNLKINVI